MAKIAFRPYAGDDREELIECQHVQRALERALPGQINVVADFPSDATHAFGRTPKHWWPSPALAYPQRDHLHVEYWNWPGFVENARRSIQVLDLASATDRVAEIHATGRAAFVKATMTKFYASVVPRGATLPEHLDALAYSFIDRGPCLIVQERVQMRREYRIFVVDGRPVTGAGTVFNHTPDENIAPFNPLVSDHPSDDNCEHDEAIVERYLAFARQVIPLMPVSSFTLDVALIEGEIGIVEINSLMLGQVGLFASDPNLLTAAVLRSCGLLPA